MKLKTKKIDFSKLEFNIRLTIGWLILSVGFVDSIATRASHAVEGKTVTYVMGVVLLGLILFFSNARLAHKK